MSKKLSYYLGFQVSCLLEDLPFKGWSYERFLEEALDEPIIQYVFPKHGMELRCDCDEKISTIFLDSDFSGADKDILDVSFGWTRQQVLACLGAPSKSGGKISDPILGDYGAWDRFVLPGHVVHVEYQIDSDRIKKMTLMRSDVVP